MTTLRAVRFAFQPMYSLHTGGVVAYEALARPGRGTAHELLAEARREGKLTEVDLGLAAAAVRQEAERPSALPLHLNLSARTLASPLEAFDELIAELGLSVWGTLRDSDSLKVPFTDLGDAARAAWVP
ncbi:EAL domain-containing protein, partial [Amycolatopsis sp. NPDC000740]|uniref:EAL domain-containing protein n=1 Tax=Amycolatopsis sp. NPDC000740 TaxID=3154269 RepID=UPI003325F139